MAENKRRLNVRYFQSAQDLINCVNHENLNVESINIDKDGYYVLFYWVSEEWFL